MSWTIVPASELPRYRTEWDDLNAACGGSPLLDAAFVEAACHSFGSGSEVLALRRRDGAAVCMGLFVRQSSFAWQTFQPANAPLGFWLAAPGDTVEKHIGSLMGRLPGFPLLVGLSQQDPAIEARPSPTRSVGVLDYIETPSLVVSGTFAAYWQSRSKNVRHNIQRQMNRLEREGRRGRFEMATAPDDMERCVADYAELESRGWKGRENTAVTVGDRQSAFYARIMAHYARLGEAAVWRYVLDDRLAASNLCIHRDGVLIILKTAYDESFKGLSPAQLMNYEALRAVFDGGGTTRIEFYGPVKDWHTKLTGDTRTMYHLNIYRGPWVKTTLALLGRHQSAGESIRS